MIATVSPHLNIMAGYVVDWLFKVPTLPYLITFDYHVRHVNET